MQITANTYAPTQAERRVSLGKLSVILASLALWAMLLGAVAMAVG